MHRIVPWLHTRSLATSGKHRKRSSTAGGAEGQARLNPSRRLGNNTGRHLHTHGALHRGAQGAFVSSSELIAALTLVRRVNICCPSRQVPYTFFSKYFAQFGFEKLVTLLCMVIALLLFSLASSAWEIRTESSLPFCCP